jgi:hypothetical protein
MPTRYHYYHTPQQHHTPARNNTATNTATNTNQQAYHMRHTSPAPIPPTLRTKPHHPTRYNNTHKSAPSPASPLASAPPRLRFLCRGSLACISFSERTAMRCASFTRSSRISTVDSSAGNCHQRGRVHTVRVSVKMVKQQTSQKAKS